MKRVLVILVSVFCLLCGGALIYALPLNERPGARVINAQYLGRASAMMNQGKAEEAWGMLRQALREDPTNVEVNLLLVRAAYATGRDNQALGALERAVTLVPDNADLRFALSKAYARAGDAAASEVEFAEAERLRPGIMGEETKIELEKMARAERKKYERFQVAGRLGLGLIWDSNASGAPDSRDIEIGALALQLDDNAKKESSLGEYATGNLNWGWRIGEDSPWYLAGDLAFYGKVYNRNLPANSHFTWGTASVGLRYMANKNLVDLRARIENASYDPDESMTAMGAEASWIYSPIPSLQVISRGGLFRRLYMEDDGKNGLYGYGGLYLRWLADERGRLSLTGGGRYLGMGAEEARWSYDGWDCILRADISLWEKLDISPYIGFREQNYHAPATWLSEYLGEENRRDHTFMAGIGLTYNFAEHIGLELGWQYFKNHSSSQLYRYDQHQINSGMVFSF